IIVVVPDRVLVEDVVFAATTPSRTAKVMCTSSNTLRGKRWPSCLLLMPRVVQKLRAPSLTDQASRRSGLTFLFSMRTLGASEGKHPVPHLIFATDVSNALPR
ncbi:unnamed protein product, partial [Scytosiphon promiscuus]